jgi:cob(I)alamin adenosyltransferase
MADTMEERLKTVQLALMRLADDVTTELTNLETFMNDRIAALDHRINEVERRLGEVEGRLGSNEYEP